MKIDRYYQGLPNSGYDNEIFKLKSIIKEGDIVYYEFDNNEICNEEFIAPFTTNIQNVKGKMFVELASKNDIWTFEFIKSKKNNDKDIQMSNGSSNIEIPPIEDIRGLENEGGGVVNTNIGRVKLIPPSPKNKNIPIINYNEYISNSIKEEKNIEKEVEEKNNEEANSKKEKEINVEKIPIVEEKKEIIVDNDPVTILVNGAKKNETIIPMQMSISLPAKELFNIVSNNFENGAEKFVDVILSQIDYDMFKFCLKDALLQAYKYEEEKIEN